MSKRFRFMLGEVFQGEGEDEMVAPDEFGAGVEPDTFGAEGDVPPVEGGEEGMEPELGDEEETEEEVLFDKMADFINSLNPEDLPEDFVDTYNEIKASLDEYEKAEGEEDMGDEDEDMDFGDEGEEDEEAEEVEDEEDDEGKKP